MLRFSGTFLLCAVLAWTVGCGSSPENAKAPPTVKVSGTVKLDGKPMEGGEVRFVVSGQAPKALPITNGAFSGEAYTGKNEIGVVWDKEAPNPMDPQLKMMVNAVDLKYLPSPKSPLNAEITGPKEFNFEVTSARK
jgi:hypothetical protein